MNIEIKTIGIYGEGVGRHEGLTLFVDGALPGERVVAEITERKKNFARAKLVQIDKRSPHRVEPPCPLFGQCGGCQLMHLDYAEQLEVKRGRVRDALKRIGKIDVEVAPCIASPEPLGYRNKIQLPYSQGRLGLYAHRSHELVEVERCALHSPLGETVIAAIRELLTESLRYLVIKTAVRTRQVLVVLVTWDREPLENLARAIMQRSSAIQGVVQTTPPEEGNRVLGESFTLLAGRSWIEEELAGLRFKISAPSFFQVNPAQAEVLYQKVMQCAALTGKERVLDAYCGVGTLSLLAAKNALEVVGIESVASAITDAEENARRNQIQNAHFICGRAEEEISKTPPFDVAILNPPRKGCDRAMLEALAERKPSRIVYVSCDPATLARDLHFLVEKGYRVGRVQPLDMFPQTTHVECVVALYFENC
jgi:23S rRNA (uracil1939-C5)-methyltransferase